VPKCEIFDRSDFADFYTIKSLRVGDFGVKIKKKNLKIFRCSFRGAKSCLTNIWGKICAFPNILLKVPKREIFDRSDFPDFCTIKSLREGDFGVKI